MNKKVQICIGIGIMVGSGLALVMEPAYILLGGLTVIILSHFVKK